MPAIPSDEIRKSSATSALFALDGIDPLARVFWSQRPEQEKTQNHLPASPLKPFKISVSRKSIDRAADRK
jgi:hypothetical protein